MRTAAAVLAAAIVVLVAGAVHTLTRQHWPDW